MSGLIVGGEPCDTRLVQQLAEEYTFSWSYIILLTIACEISTSRVHLLAAPTKLVYTADFKNQSAHHLVA